MAGKRDGLFKRGRIWWHRDPVTGRQASTHCTDIEAARAHHRARERVAADPATAAAAEAELGHWCDQTVALKRRDSSESTIRFYTQKLGQVLGFFGRDFRLSELTPPAVDRYVDKRRTDGVTDHTIVHEFSCLLQVLKLAKRAECFPGDLAALRPLDLHAHYVPRKRALPREEVVRLLAVLEPSRAAFVALTVGLGLRLSEAFRLLPSDVDLEHNRVFVGGTKTEESRRHLPILSVMRSLVKEGARHLPLEPWQNMVRDLAVACRRACIEPCTANDLRRSHATLLIEAGVPRDVVRRLLGHTTAAMVDRVYGKPRPEALGALAEQVVGLLEPIPTQQVSDSGSENCGANSGNRTPDLRFTKPLEGSGETASARETSASGDLAVRGQAWRRDGEHTSTQQCSYPWSDVVHTANLTERQSDSGYIDLSAPLRGHCPNAARGADDSYSSAKGAATVCWHCGDHLLPEEHPHCERCPDFAVGCDDGCEDCEARGAEAYPECLIDSMPERSDSAQADGDREPEFAEGPAYQKHDSRVRPAVLARTGDGLPLADRVMSANHSHAAGMVPEEISEQVATSPSETNRRVTFDRFDLAAAYARVLSRRNAA